MGLVSGNHSFEFGSVYGTFRLVAEFTGGYNVMILLRTPLILGWTWSAVASVLERIPLQ